MEALRAVNDDALIEEDALSIDETEIMLQGFAMDNPNATENDINFTRAEYAAAHDVVQYTSKIDEKLGVEVVEGGAIVSRDVLATYKTLMYKTLVNGQVVQDKLRKYQQIAAVLGVGFLIVVGLNLSK